MPGPLIKEEVKRGGSSQTRSYPVRTLILVSAELAQMNVFIQLINPLTMIVLNDNSQIAK